MQSFRMVFLLLACCFTKTTLVAAEQPPTDAKTPTQEELTTLFSGNSNEGVWAGRSYLQHFSVHGSTRYQEVGRAISVGQWRVNEQGQYCSVWPPSPKWVCYNVLVAGDDIYWESGDNYYKSQVILGDIFK